MVRKNHTLGLLFRMQLRNIRKNIAQFLAIIVIGAIAVTLFVGLQSNADVFETQINTAFRQGNLPDLYVTTSSYDSEDEASLDNIVKEKGILDKRLYVPAKIGNHDVYMVVTDSIPKLSSPYGEVNDRLSGFGDEFVLLDEGLEDKKKEGAFEKYQIGDGISLTLDLSLLGVDTTNLTVSSSFLRPEGINIFSNGSLSLPFSVTDFMQHPENITKANYNPGVCLISYSMFQKSLKATLKANFNDFACSYIEVFLERYFGKGILKNEKLSYFNQYLIRFHEGADEETYFSEIRNYYETKEKNNLLLLTRKEEMPFYLTVSADATQARQFTYVFPFVFFLVAVLVILTTLSQLIFKDRTSIGTLKALGLKKKEILFNYLSLTTVLVSVGILLGWILGPLIIPSILGQKYKILYSLPEKTYQFPWAFALLSGLVFLLLAGLVTYIVAYKELKLKPVESMRPIVPKWKQRKKERKGKNSVLSLSIKMAFRNLRLDKFRSVMVVIGILGCTALLVCGYGLEDTINYGIQNDRSIFLNSDITLTLKDTFSEEEMQNRFLSVDGIEAIEPYRRKEMTYSKPGGKQTTKVLYILSGSSESLGMEMPEDGIAVSEKIAETIGVSLGDEIQLTSGNTSRTIPVTKIFKAFYYNCAVLPHDSPFILPEEKYYNGAWINVNDQSDEKEIADLLRERDEVSAAISSDSFAMQIRDVMSGILMMTTAVKVFAVLLAVVTLYNLALLTYQQRLRDMATLKVLGFRKREIALSLLTESLVLTLIGVIFGLFLGYPFMLLVLKTNIVELVQYLFHITPLSYFLAFVETFVVAFVINLYFAYHTKKIKMVESLKAVE